MAKRKAKSSIEGCWNIVSVSGWDEEHPHVQEQAFIDIGPEDIGDFHFGYVRGDMDCRAAERDGKPAVEFTWEGNNHTGHAFGRGWAVLDVDELKKNLLSSGRRHRVHC
jgi:hypothetical protein